MQHVVAIINPRSGGRRGARLLARRLARLRAAGIDDCRVTDHPRHAETIARDVEADTLIAVGGDGLVHEIANGLMHRPPPPEAKPLLGVVPTGSGDDFAFACGLPRDFAAALDVARFGEPAAVDAARIRDASGRQRWFVNSAGMLFDAAVNMHSHRMPCGGFAKYALATVTAMARNYRPNDVQLILDGQTSRHQLVMLTIANGPREGGRFLCAPPARNDDGQLDLLLVNHVSRLNMLRLLPQVMKGTHVTHPACRLMAGCQIMIRLAEPTAIHLDGELWSVPKDGVREIAIGVQKAALQIRGRRNIIDGVGG